MVGQLIKPQPVQKVYLAGGNPNTTAAISEFLSHLDIKPIMGKRNQSGVSADWRALADSYNHNLRALAKCDLFLALLDGTSTEIADVCVEMGLAYANGTPILGLCPSAELRTSPMVVGMCRGDDYLAMELEELKELIEEHISMADSMREDDIGDL